MNEIRIFENSAFGELEVREIEGKLHFPATACARMLGYEEPQSAVRQHCRCCVKHTVPHPQSKTKTISINYIPEGDL